MSPDIGPETTLDERFRLTELRERGWRGNFFTAEDGERDGQRVDIEVMRAGGRQEEQYERLVRREVDIGDWLKDLPQVLRAVAWGRHDSGWLWVARDWVEGAKPLDVTDGTQDERVWRVLDAAQTVCTLTERGIVHRDLGAQSILTTEQGFRLARFGLAKLDEVSDPWAGPAGLPFLHLRCVAPEAFDRPGSTDERADVYAFGVLLFRALTNRWPYPGPSLPQLVAQQLRVQLGNRDLPVPSKRKPVPEELDAICQAALQPDPARRTKSVAAFVEALETYLSVSGIGRIEPAPVALEEAKPAPIKSEPKAEPVKAEPVKAEPVAEIAFSEPEPAAKEVEISGLDFESSEELIPAESGAIEDLDPDALDLGGLDLAASGDMLEDLDLTPSPAPVPVAAAPGAKPGGEFASDFGASGDDLVAVELSDDAADPQPVPVPAMPGPADPADPFAGDDFLEATGAEGGAFEDDPFANAKPGVDIDGLPGSTAAASAEPNPFGATQLEDATGEFNVLLAPPGASPVPLPPMPEIEPEELLPPAAFDDFEVERGILLTQIHPEDLAELVENLNQLDPKGLSHLLLDMSGVESLGTDELEALTQVRHVARRRKLQAGMFGVTRGVRHVLQLMDMSEQVPFLLSADDRKDALMEIASLG